MKISLPKNSLVSALKTVSVVQTKHDKKRPILNTVLFELKDNDLRLSATDLESECIVTIPSRCLDVVNANNGILFAIEPKPMLNTLNMIHDDIVNLTYDTEYKSLILHDSKTTMNLETMEGEDFPPVTVSTDEEVMTLFDSKKLKVALKNTSAIDSNNIDLITQVVFFQLDESETTFYTTDHKRLMIERMAMCNVNFHTFALMKYTIKNMVKIMPNNGAVILRKTQYRYQFSWDNVVFQTRAVEVRSPQFQRVIPKNYDLDINFNRKQLLDILVPIAKMTKKTEVSMVKLVVENHNIRVTYENKETNYKFESFIPCNLNGNETTIRLEPRYVVDILKVLDDDMVSLKFSHPTYPVVFSDNNNIQYVLMQISE